MAERFLPCFAQERSDSSERLFGDVSCSAVVVATCYYSIELDSIYIYIQIES